MPYYGVRDGRNPGVYGSWWECEEQVSGYSCADFRKFDTPEEAYYYVYTYCDSNYCSSDSDSSNSDSDSSCDEDNSQDVFTDGACINNGEYDAAAGIGVYWGPGDCRNVSERHDGRQTNNSAEIYAAIRAIRQAEDCGIDEINLYTDSQFLLKGITTWIHNWRQNGWTTVDGYPLKNLEGFQELDHLLGNTDVHVNWEHVYAHSGNFWNDEADRLAREGCFM